MARLRTQSVAVAYWLICAFLVAASFAGISGAGRVSGGSKLRRRQLKRACAVLDGHFPNGAAPDDTTPCLFAQDLQFLLIAPTIRSRNRPAKQVGDQRWLNLHSLNRSSTRSSVLCAVSASPECLMNRGELHRPRTGSPAHCSRPSGPGSTFPSDPPDFPLDHPHPIAESLILS